MKRVLPTSNFTFTPSLNRVDFTPMGAGFKKENLYAIINITTGKLIYAVASVSSGFGGSFAGYILTYSSSNIGQLASDTLQVIYDDETAVQNITGSVTIQDPANVRGTVGTSDAIASAVHDGSGTYPILSSVDPVTGRDGLDINILTSSYGGELNNPLPIPFQNQAMSVGFINGGNLSSPAMDLATNQLIVDATQSGNLPVAVAGTVSVSLDAVTTTQTIPVSTADLYVTGFGPQTTVSNNVLESVSTANSTDVSGYRSGVVQIVSNSTTGTYIFEQSADNINFTPLAVFGAGIVNPNATVTAITPTVGTTVFHFPIKARYIRCRIATVLNSTGIRAFSRFSQETWAPTALQVVNATGGNLNAVVSQPAAANLNVTAAVTGASLSATTVTDIASAAITTTQTSANITTGNQQNVAFQVSVTATSGTNQTLDVVVQETFDGTNFVDMYHFPRITAVGQYTSPQMRCTGAGIRYVRTVGGTSPSFTNSVIRPVRQTGSDIYRNFLSRTIDPNTLNSTTATYYVEGCDEFQLVANMNAGGTAPVFKMQGSEDGANWFDMPSLTLTATVGAVTQIMTSGTAMPKFIRGIVSTAGVGASLICLHLKARGV